MLASQENFIIPESFYWIQITVDWRRQERGCHLNTVMYIDLLILDYAVL